MMTVFARKKLFAYKTVIFTIVATGVLSFFVWAHHQFVAGIDPRMANVFVVTTVLISIPIAEMCFVYIATLYGGSITFSYVIIGSLRDNGGGGGSGIVVDPTLSVATPNNGGLPTHVVIDQ